MNAVDLLIAIRGGLPECCDFCGQPFNESRAPVPEEAGEWACTECTEHWRIEENTTAPQRQERT